MNSSTIEKIKKKYDALEEASAKFAKGEINSAEIKKFTAPLGIYEQRDAKFMMRIRTPGGELSSEQIRFILSLAEEYGIESLHITTRQDLQMHDVPALKLASIARKFLDAGMPFYGGGADTFRNVTSCPHAGFTANSVFDTIPYAKAVSASLMDYDKAFELPRKFKIAFSCCPDDFAMAKFNDLGFIANFADAKRGFEVYSGGGMGRESNPGIKIFDFVEEKEIFRIAIATVNMFHDLGNRNDRSKARLRFVLREKGEQFFREQFHKYLASASEITLHNLKQENTPAEGELVRLFIPNGNLTREQLAKIANTAFDLGAKFLRFSQEQDIFAGAFHKANAKIFISKFPEFSGHNIRGLVKSCVGAKVCKIGLLDAKSHALAASLKLDELLSKYPENQRLRLSEKICEMIKISGCHNSCGLNRAAKFGFQGTRRNIDGEVREFYIFQTGASKSDGIISKNEGIEIQAEQLPDFIQSLISKELEIGNIK